MTTKCLVRWTSYYSQTDYRPSSGTKFIKPTLADTHKYTAGNLKRLAVANQISQNYLLQLTQRNRQGEDLQARLAFQGVETDLSQLFATGSGTETAVYKTLPEPRQTSWCEHAFCISLSRQCGPVITHTHCLRNLGTDCYTHWFFPMD